MAYRNIDSVSKKIRQKKEKTISNSFSNLKPSRGIKGFALKPHFKKQHLQKLSSAYLMMLMIFQSLAGVFVCLPTQKASAATSWYSDYAYRVKIPVSASSSGAQTDYQMSLTLHTKTGINTPGDVYLNSHLQDTTTFNDIRFTDTSNNLKNFWIEKIEDETGGRKATVWVKLNTPASGTTDYYLYYGKTNDTSASSYDNTFTKDYNDTGLVGLWHMDETPGSELLTDGNLETWTNSTTLTNWTSDNALTGVRDITEEATNKQVGNYALKLSATANDGIADFGVYQNIITAANQTYQINFYQYYASHTAGTLVLEAWDNTNNVSLGSSQAFSTQSTAYSYSSFRFTSTNTSSVKIKIYLFNETTGTAYIDSISVKQSANTLIDSSGNSNTGTIYGASRTDADGGQWKDRSDVKFSQGSALQFDGVNDYVDGGNGTSLNNLTSFSVEAWVNSSNVSSYGTVIAKNNSTSPTGGAGFILYRQVDGSFSFLVYDGSGKSRTVNSSICEKDKWCHLSGTMDGNNITIYINGAAVSSVSVAGLTWDAVHTLKIGSNAYSTALIFNGKIDEARLYNRALSANEISRHYIRSKYATISPSWSASCAEEQLALGIVTQVVSISTVTTSRTALNGYLTGFGEDASANVYFKYGTDQFNLDQITAMQARSDYGSFSQSISGLASNTIYYYQAVVANSSGTAYGSVLSLRTAFVLTDYYYGFANNDGTISLTDKNTGELILDSSPKFFLNYGATNTSSVTLLDASFESGVVGQRPTGWMAPSHISADSTFIVTDERASDGAKSLKITNGADEIVNSMAYSPLLTITQDSSYSISVDTYLKNPSAYTKGVYIYYYTTSDGTGASILSTSSVAINNTAGAWKTNILDWAPPTGAKSFRIAFYAAYQEKNSIYWDNIQVHEITNIYNNNGNNIASTITSDNDRMVITSSDDSNPTARIDHRYELNLHTPFINYIPTLYYKQNASVVEERFDFTVPAQSGSVMTRDFKLVDIDPAQTYYADLYSPKVVKFSNGLALLGKDTMQGMRLQSNGGSGMQLSLYTDRNIHHPFSSAENKNGTILRSAGNTYSSSITFSFEPLMPKTLVKSRQPYGYDAALTFTNHADNETLARVNAVAYGTEDVMSSDYGTKGIVGRGLGWTKSVFVSGQTSPYGDLEDSDYISLTDKMYQDGVEIVGHSITQDTDDRTIVDNGMLALSRYSARNWIDHGAGLEGIGCRGTIIGDPYYDIDLFQKYGYRYAWSRADFASNKTTINILMSAVTAENSSYFFYNNQVDNNASDDKKIYLWSAINTNKTPESYYTNSNVDSLITERGVHIGHEYLAYSDAQNHAFYTNLSTGKVEITPTFDSELAYIAQKKEAGLIWSPTVSKMGDYLVPLKDVSVTNNDNGSYTVTNNSTSSLTGITLLAENDLKSVNINNKTLTSFGNSFGSKELVLPTLNPRESFTLYLSYGTKDTSIPTITSNDTGKKKVNELTGVYDNNSQTLTMTAEGNSETRSFTIKLPALAGKRLLVQDTSTNTSIGDYLASNTGEITFSAPLGSIHTFLIAEVSNTAFISPSKPQIGNVSISKDSSGTLTFNNIPSTIAQIAVSTTEDFKNASWEYIKDVNSILSRYADKANIYLKFRTQDGATSDTITYTPSQTPGNDQNNNNNPTPLQDGDTVKTPSSPDIYVIKTQNNKKYKRLILSPNVFNSYHHLKWENIKTITEEELNQYQTSSLVKELTDTIVYTLTPDGDTGKRKPFDITQTYDPDSIYTINKVDRDSYEWEE